MSEVGIFIQEKDYFNFFLSYELGEEVSHGRAPVEMGISVNKTWMLENNISDINVYFKDPINNVPFISPKETYPDYLMYNIFVVFSLRFMIRDLLMTTRPCSC